MGSSFAIVGIMIFLALVGIVMAIWCYRRRQFQQGQILAQGGGTVVTVMTQRPAQYHQTPAQSYPGGQSPYPNSTSYVPPPQATAQPSYPSTGAMPYPTGAMPYPTGAMPYPVTGAMPYPPAPYSGAVETETHKASAPPMPSLSDPPPPYPGI